MAEDRYPIQLQGVGKSFGSVQVLRGIDLTVPRGTMFALLGPNGAGKTTLVRILTTLLDLDGGTARINGCDVATQPAAVRRSLGLTGQYAAVDKLLTGRENLIMMGRLYRLRRAEAIARAEELLEQFDLRDAARRRVKTYSGGMRRRLDLAISLIAAPPIVFLDEPTTGLDPRGRATMWDAIRMLLRDGVTIFLTTQYLEEADQLADNVGVLDGGRIIAEGTPQRLKHQVGAERLELGFADDATLRAAMTAIEGQGVPQEDKQHTLSLPLHDARHLKSLLDRLESSDVDIKTIAIAQPTLDDVFLTLTGKTHTDTEEAGLPAAERVNS
ncbi:ATP-binding cassette domain-containing protein [Amycolatopsis sp. NPDC059021]|uniref:ATP-binding cassette domain-containing protein n=1 Tax=Amycolatopsis sp. NPDC059021 TaxID=3346704 RepID=UPI00366C6B58